MKKTIALMLSVLLVLALLAGCNGQDNPPVSQPPSTSPNESLNSSESETSPSPSPPNDETSPTPPSLPDPVNIRIGGLVGPGGMGMVKLLEDAENGLTHNTYEYYYGGSPDELTPRFLQGGLDIIAVPANLASIIYNNTSGGARVLTITARGIMYILEKGGEDIQTVEDLRGQEMFSVGKGSSSEFAMRHIFEANGLHPDNDVTIEWRVEPTEVLAMLSARDHGIAMLPQPFATIAQIQMPEMRIALDLTKEWDDLGTDSQFLTTAFIVDSEFADTHPEALGIFLEEFAASTDYVNANIPEAADLIEKYLGLAPPVAARALPYCNLVSISGAEMKRIMQSYLEVIHEQNPASVGGTLPGNDFYHGAD